MLITLSDRTRQILDYLLRMEQPVSTAQIASRFELTSPQVRYCFRYLQPWLRQRDITLSKRPRVGIKIESSATQRETLLAELREMDGYKLVLAPAERKQLLLLRLLLACNPLPLDELREDLGVSRTTLFRDLASAREWLRLRGLGLTTHRRHGVHVAGGERLWREAVIDLLLRNLSQGVLVSACVGAEPRSTKQEIAGQSFLREACDFLDNLNLSQAECLVTFLEQQLQLVFVDEARVNLVLHVSLTLLRVPIGKLISTEEGHSDFPVTPDEFQASQEMMRKMEEVVGRDIPSGELRYLASKIAKSIEAGAITNKQHEVVEDETESSALELATLLAREAARYLHVGLEHDQEFIDCLTLELSAQPSNWPTSLSLANHPTRNAIGTMDPLYGFTYRILRPIMKRYSYVSTERVLSAVAMHLGTALERLSRIRSRRRVWVICGAGLATVRNLISRLNLRLPELEIIGLASAFELIRNPELVSGADAIISTIPLEGVAKIPLLHVSPLLTPQDTEKLRGALGIGRYEAKPAAEATSEGGLSMVDILSPESIDRDANASRWEDVVDRAGALLLRVGAIWPSYIKAMKDMIRLYGPYVVIAPGAALLHASPEMGGKHLAMSLVVLRTPVPFGHELHDPVRLALAFSSIDYRTHARAVGEAMRLLSEKDLVRSILEAPSEKDILKTVWQIVNRE